MSFLFTDGADDDTIIYPRAASRIGRKFQADLPEIGGARLLASVAEEEAASPAPPQPAEVVEANTNEVTEMEEDQTGGRASPPNAGGAEYRHKGRIPLWRKRLMMQEEAKEAGADGNENRRDLDEELVFSLPDNVQESDGE